MSIGLVEELHLRLRSELDRLGLKLAEAARLADESTPQRLKDVVSGRQRCSAELLAKLALLGVDAQFVLTGEGANASAPTHLPADEQLLLESYRALPVAQRKALLADLLTGNKPIKAKAKAVAPGVTVTASGSGSRAAGRDYIER